MSLKDRINEDMKSAMRAKDSARLSAIRMLMASMKQREVDERITLDDPAIVAIVDKLIKQRKDSIVQYEAGKRMDLAEAERFEVTVLAAYLPAQAGSEEIAAVIDAAITACGATSPGDMGKVMALVKAKLAGRADMGEISKAIKARLAAA